jgi:hypothetical protein
VSARIFRTLRPEFASGRAHCGKRILKLPGSSTRAATMRYRAVASITLLGLSSLCASAYADEGSPCASNGSIRRSSPDSMWLKKKATTNQRGLDVNIQPGGPDFPAVQMVTGGNEQFGVTGADQVLIARKQGRSGRRACRRLPAQSLCAVFARQVRHQRPGRLRRQESRLEDRRQRGVDLPGHTGQGEDRQIRAHRDPGQVRHHAAP